MSGRLLGVRDIGLARLALLHAACFPDDAWDAPAFAGLLAMAGAGGRVWLSEDGALLGLILDLFLGEEAEILTLGVAPASRRGGVARALLNDFCARMRAAGAQRGLLEVAADNQAALALYEDQGFAIVGRRPGYYRRPDGAAIDAWRLMRPL